MSKVSVKSLRRLANMLPESADVVAGALTESADYIEELENLISTMTDKIINLQKQVDTNIVLVNNGWEEERYALQEENISLVEQQSLLNEINLKYYYALSRILNLNHFSTIEEALEIAREGLSD